MPAWFGSTSGLSADRWTPFLGLAMTALWLASLFVLTTKTAHWFLERGFRSSSIADLPREKQSLYNYQRKSLVYRKPL